MALLDIIACIDAVLDGVESRQAAGFDRKFHKILRFRFRCLKRFALTICSSNLGREESLRSLLVTVEDDVRAVAAQSHHPRRGRNDANFPQVIVSELKAIVYWHECDAQISVQVLQEMITCILEALMDLRATVASPNLTENARRTIEDLEEQMYFLKGFTGEINVVSQAVSFYSGVCYLLSSFESLRVFVSKVSNLLQEMKPMYTTFARGLCITLLLNKDDDDDGAFVEVKHFLDPLMSYLWHLLGLGNRAASIKVPLELDEGIRSLRDILKIEPSNLGLKFKKQRNIGTVQPPTSIIACIDTALDDVEVQQATGFHRECYMILGFIRLKILKRLALTICSSNMGREESLRFLFVKIINNIRRIAKQGHHPHQVSELKTMVYWQKPQNSGGQHVLEMRTYIMKALLDLQSTVASPQFIENARETIQELEEQMSFVKGLITLTEKTSAVSVVLSQAASFYSRASYIFSNFKYLRAFVTEVSNLLHEETMYAVLTHTLSKKKLLCMDVDDFTAVKHYFDPLISYLWYLLRLDSRAVSFKDLLELYVGIRSLRAVVKLQPDINVEIKQGIAGAVWNAGTFICSLHCSLKVIKLQNLLDKIKAILTDIGPQQAQEEEFFTATSIKVDELKTSPATSITDEGVVGFQEEGIVAVDQLTRGSMQLQILAIVGMPGLGKTTFATMVYNNPYVSLHFHIRACSLVSQVVDDNKVLRDLFNQIDPAKCSKMPEQDLADGLRKSLKGRRYLIFLDDVWDVEVWTRLKDSFPDDNVGSRIILTSRHHNIAPPDLMVDGIPHSLHPLNEDESLELLLSRSGYSLPPPLLLSLKMKIADKCRGFTFDNCHSSRAFLKSVELEGWDEILDRLSDVSSSEQCRSTLELSYRHLPAYLRPCLLYFGVLREDREVSVRRLVRLWIAEGFVQKDGMKSLEDVAEDYLNDLIGRSLIMVGKQRTLGGVKAWKIHDLIRDFCKHKAREEHFFHFLKGHDELSAYNDEVQFVPRLCIDSEAEHFRKSRLFAPCARSLIFNSTQPTNFSEENMGWLYFPPAIHFSKLVKVLDLEQVHFGLRFPDEIKQLLQLTFLAVQGNVLEIPEWIGNLPNLETFVFVGESICQLPRTLWKLPELQYLYIGTRSYCSLPEGNWSSSTLCKLDRISGVIIQYRDMKGTMRMFSNIRKLRCTLRWEKEDHNDLEVPSLLSKLESLNVLDQGPVRMLDRVSFPANLKKLTLKRFSLSWRSISAIGELPNLEVLKLIRITFEGESWEMKEGEFNKLRFLKLGSSALVRWLVDSDEDQLDCLQKLVLTDCPNLEEMPYCLDNIATLEIIEVSSCRSTTVEMVRQIEERRKDLMGDSGLKIITNNIWD